MKKALLLCMFVMGLTFLTAVNGVDTADNKSNMSAVDTQKLVAETIPIGS